MSSVLYAAVLFLAAIYQSQSLRHRADSYVGLQHVETRPPPIPQRLQTFILGGTIAEEAVAPWQVSVQNQHGNHFCGGAIIADQYVITAASCVAGLQRSQVKVITSTNDWMGLAWKYNVENIFIHCSFDKPLYHNDIALLKLDTMIDYDAKTQNITIVAADALVEGEELSMTGWGSWELGESYPEKLKILTVKYVTPQKCKQLYGNSNDLDGAGHLCAAAQLDEGACHGDTGGPLVNSKGQLVGIGNWGVPCGRGFPDVFAKLSHYYDWIRTTISGCKIKS